MQSHNGVMTKSGLFRLSVGLNAALLGVVIWQAVMSRRTGATNAGQPNSSAASNSERTDSGPDHGQSAPSVSMPVEHDLPRMVVAQNAGIPVSLAAISSNRPSWQWRQLESDDYRAYIKNLRDVGCPEQTVRDIVSADLVQGFASRRAEIAETRFRDFAYWKADATDAQARRVFDSDRQTLDGEMADVYRQLLGNALTPPSTADEWRAAALTQELAFLPQEKRDEVKSILMGSAQIDEQAKDLAANEKITEDANQREQIMDAYDQKKTDLKALLDADQFKRVELTTSWTAENLRRALVHFQPTEAEFTAIFDQWQPFDESLARLHARGGNDPGNLQKPVLEAIRNALGDARFAEYQQAWWK